MRTPFIAAVIAALTLPAGAAVSQEKHKASPLDGSWKCVRIETRSGALQPKSGEYDQRIGNG